MIIGGEFVPRIQQAFDVARFDSVSVPIAVGLIVMMWPVLTKVQYETLPKMFQSSRIWTQIGLSLCLNWIQITETDARPRSQWGNWTCKPSSRKQRFSQATHTILSKIPPDNSKLTYVWEQFLLHYIPDGGFTYLADDAAGRCLSVPLSTHLLTPTQKNAFAFLADLKIKFTALPSSSSSSSSSSTIASQMQTYNTHR